MSQLIETIRYSEGRIQNIDYHLRRMEDSSMALFGDTLHWKPKQMLRDIELPADKVYKIRLVYNFTGGKIKTEPYTIRPVRSLKLVTDNDISYDFKFENRTAIERLIDMKGDCDDILVIKNGLITDVSYANIIFKKDDYWYTPDSFLLNGTMRQYLLDRSKIKQTKITPSNIGDFSHFKLINAMLGDEAPESEVSNIR